MRTREIHDLYSTRIYASCISFKAHGDGYTIPQLFSRKVLTLQLELRRLKKDDLENERQEAFKLKMLEVEEALTEEAIDVIKLNALAIDCLYTYKEMGCVQSSQTRRSARAKQARLKSNDDCNSAQSPMEEATPVTNTNSGNNEEIQFRRQHFDRNSMLRHSKKRRKSSASASPNVTINNKSMTSVTATPNRLKPMDSYELKKALRSPSPPPSSSRPTSSSLTNFAHENRATASLSSSKNDENKPRMPNSTSPEHLQRQNSGRLI
ncbi:unnamed protein product [Lepeophtheirus salmonis]|uniref:(salmon louse) hypothetical protein n=1 Tax=Lepeophtheirus salmonis TaxID=72036 RepID=A0A7R8CFD8_LEPSM|nr:unnamed protein product [Lepeophtheirus salmonis]CAF2750793.1 unnamed protein product [Lepeophtheirus salmonis]